MIVRNALALIAIPLLSISVFADTEMAISRLNRISKAVVDLTTDSALLENKEFLDLFRHPNGPQILEVLSDESVAEQTKIIAVLSVQRLALPDALRFLRKVCELRQQEKIPQSVFEVALFPGYKWSTKLEENFQDSGVMSFLTMLMTSNIVTPNEKDRIADILNGEAKERVRQWRHVQQELDKVKKWQ